MFSPTNGWNSGLERGGQCCLTTHQLVAVFLFEKWQEQKAVIRHGLRASGHYGGKCRSCRLPWTHTMWIWHYQPPHWVLAWNLASECNFPPFPCRNSSWIHEETEFGSKSPLNGRSRKMELANGWRTPGIHQAGSFLVHSAERHRHLPAKRRIVVCSRWRW